MIKFINNITQIIILLGCCAISIFILFVLITFIKNVDDFAAITNIYDYIRMQNITIKIDTILFTVIVISYLNRINNTIQIREYDDMYSCAYTGSCTDISTCKLCFLNANNYLNVLKYIKQKDLKQKSNYLKKLQILREMPYKLLHHVIKYNVLFDYINSVEFFVGLYGDKPIEIMKNDLNILERNNKIFKFKPY